VWRFPALDLNVRFSQVLDADPGGDPVADFLQVLRTLEEPDLHPRAYPVLTQTKEGTGKKTRNPLMVLELAIGVEPTTC